MSNNNLRRMQAWAKTIYPDDWEDRCAVVTEYLAQASEDLVAALIKQGWADVFTAAERDWPEAFAGWKEQRAEDAS